MFYASASAAAMTGGIMFHLSVRSSHYCEFQKRFDGNSSNLGSKDELIRF